MNPSHTLDHVEVFGVGSIGLYIVHSNIRNSYVGTDVAFVLFNSPREENVLVFKVGYWHYFDCSFKIAIW